MTDKAKFIGTPETFRPENVNDLLSKGIINSVSNIEKAIFSLEYAGQLQEEGLDFIFKGGSAVQILLCDKWNRLSVDIDICTDASEKELKSILEKIHLKFGSKAFAYNLRKKEIDSSIPFYSYGIKTPPITNRERVFLLDVLGTKPRFSIQQTPLKAFFFDSSIKVTAPTISALLGDKLSTVGPNTIGRPLKDSRNGLEYAKHFYDIGNLQESGLNLRECVEAYSESITIQSKIRNTNFIRDECFHDTLFTCQVASLSQQLGEQVIEKLKPVEKARAKSEFEILQRGLQRFRPFLVKNRTYTWDHLRSYASLTALLIKIINSDLKDDQVKDILNIKTPIEEKEISELIERIKTIPKEQRWFIVPDEMINFPKILKTWHDFFFLNEITCS